MAEKALSKIEETEARAQNIVTQAREEAALIIRRAEETAADMLLQSAQKSKEAAEEMLRQAETASLESNIGFSEETQRQCAALKAQLLLRDKAAVEAVIKTVMKAVSFSDDEEVPD